MTSNSLHSTIFIAVDFGMAFLRRTLLIFFLNTKTQGSTGTTHTSVAYFKPDAQVEVEVSGIFRLEATRRLRYLATKDTYAACCARL